MKRCKIVLFFLELLQYLHTVAESVKGSHEILKDSEQ